MAQVMTQAEADTLNATMTYGPYHAANGHTMMAEVLDAYDYTDEGRRVREYRVGDEIRYTTWNAWCTSTCYACRQGDMLPDW